MLLILISDLPHYTAIIASVDALNEADGTLTYTTTLFIEENPGWRK